MFLSCLFVPMSISTETLCIETVCHVKLSVEYIPSEEVVYKLKKKNFPQSIPSMLAIATYIPKKFWGLQDLQSWHSTLSQCFWLLANESRLAARRAYAHKGPKIPRRYLVVSDMYLARDRINQGYLKNIFLDLENIILHLICVLQGFVRCRDSFQKKKSFFRIDPCQDVC